MRVAADWVGMATSAIAPSAGALAATTQSEVVVSVLSKALKRQREEAARLVRLVEQATASGDRGQHVNYYA